MDINWKGKKNFRPHRWGSFSSPAWAETEIYYLLVLAFSCKTSNLATNIKRATNKKCPDVFPKYVGQAINKPSGLYTQINVWKTTQSINQENVVIPSIVFLTEHIFGNMNTLKFLAINTKNPFKQKRSQ